MWVVTAICLAGTILNIKKHSLCFVLWAIGNILWLIYDIYTAQTGRALLDIVQLGTCIWGLLAWRRERHNGQQN